MLVFSEQANVWKLGCWDNFRDEEALQEAHNIILNRYLSWSFVNHMLLDFGSISWKGNMFVKTKNIKRGSYLHRY